MQKDSRLTAAATEEPWSGKRSMIRVDALFVTTIIPYPTVCVLDRIQGDPIVLTDELKNEGNSYTCFRLDSPSIANDSCPKYQDQDLLRDQTSPFDGEIVRAFHKNGILSSTSCIVYVFRLFPQLKLVLSLIVLILPVQQFSARNCPCNATGPNTEEAQANLKFCQERVVHREEGGNSSVNGIIRSDDYAAIGKDNQEIWVCQQPEGIRYGLCRWSL